MKIVSYAGQQLVTTDDVADALVVLAAEIANEGRSQALQIPIVVDGRENTAELVVGLGNDVLVGPQSSDGNDPDFSAQAQKLRSHPFYPKPNDQAADAEDDGFESWNLDVDLDTSPHIDRRH
jgi:hypothetical protein